ncbi:MAG: substrate-binding periplasmic protein [Gammaproteobacteria bacterium]
MLWVALLTAVSATGAAPLRVCLLSHNLPYSAREAANGFDADIARAVAGALEHEFVPVWIEHPASIQEIDDSDIPARRLARGECDAIFSVPGPARDSLKGFPTLALGVAYYGAAFELIGVSGIAADLKALRAKPVAIQAQTVASFALAILQAKQRTYFSVGSALDGVVAGDAEVALLWGPTAGWHLAQYPALSLRVAEAYEPPAALRWNLYVATRLEDKVFRKEVDMALRKLHSDGEIERSAARYGIPFHAPFATTYSLTEINKLR